jgi:hypothetical protein
MMFGAVKPNPKMPPRSFRLLEEFTRSCRVCQCIRSFTHKFHGQLATLAFLVLSCLLRRFNDSCNFHGLHGADSPLSFKLASQRSYENRM